VRSLVVALGILVVLVGAAAPARAEDVAAYEVEGDADAGGADPRVAALDEAFLSAVATAIQEVVDPETRKANKGVLDKEILSHARVWVAKFTVTKDETANGRRQLAVTVRVDRDKMRVRLAELNIATQAAGGGAAGPSAIVLVRIVDPDGFRASYGSKADKELPGLAALSAVLRGAGMTIQRAPPSATARPGGELPVDDDEADALAALALVDEVALANVTVGPAVQIRGIASVGVLVQARVRLVAKGKKVIGDSVATTAARGAEASVVRAAIEHALANAAADVVPPPKPTLGQSGGFKGDDSPIAEPGVVLVRVSPKTPYVLVAAELKYLAGAKGVTRAVLRRVSAAGWVIGVSTTESVQRVAAIARKAPTADSTSNVKVVGDLIELTLAGPP
jgi:hypothetical protein